MPRELAPGVVFEGRYRLERRLGAGGTSTVWLATDEVDPGRPRVALKLLHANFAPNGRAADRLASEAAVLLQLRHPNIVRARDFAQGQHGVYLVLDYAEGETLALRMQRTVERRSTLSVAEVGLIFSQLCAAVECAHEAGVIHRDLKPHNIIVSENAAGLRVRVLDFGLAKLIGAAADNETTIGRALGSYLYMSPEQALGAPIDERTDVFALGTILFELLTLRRTWARRPDGRPVLAFAETVDFEGPNAAPAVAERIARGDRPLPREHRPELPRALDLVVARALAIAREDRTASVGLLHADFLRAVVEQASAQDAPSGEATVAATAATDVTPRAARGANDDPRRTRLDAELSRARLPVVGPAPRVPTLPFSPDPGEVSDTAVRPEGELLFSVTAPAAIRPPTPPPPKLGGPVALALILGAGAAGLLGASLLPPLPPTPVAERPPTEHAPAPVEVRAAPRAATIPRSQEPDAPAETSAAPPEDGEEARGLPTRRALGAPAARREAPPEGEDATRERPATKDAPRARNDTATSGAASLEARLEALKRGPAEPAAIAELGRAVMDAAERVRDPDVQRRVKRLAYASLGAGDLVGLEECIRRLQAAEATDAPR